MPAIIKTLCGGSVAGGQAPACHRHIKLLLPQALIHQLAGHRLKLARCSIQHRHRQAVTKQVCRAASATEQIVEVDGEVVDNKIPVTVGLQNMPIPTRIAASEDAF